jgi:hypothetical protein
VIYHLLAAPGRVSDLILQPGEVITSIAAGDTARWTIGDTSSGSGEAKRVHVLVKPFCRALDQSGHRHRSADLSSAALQHRRHGDGGHLMELPGG